MKAIILDEETVQNVREEIHTLSEESTAEVCVSAQMEWLSEVIELHMDDEEEFDYLKLCAKELDDAFAKLTTSDGRCVFNIVNKRHIQEWEALFEAFMQTWNMFVDIYFEGVDPYSLDFNQESYYT